MPAATGAHHHLPLDGPLGIGHCLAVDRQPRQVTVNVRGQHRVEDGEERESFSMTGSKEYGINQGI